MKVSSLPHPHNPARFYVLPAAFFVLIIGICAYIFTTPLDQPQTQASETSLTQAQPENLLPIEEVKKLAALAAPGSSITKINLTKQEEKLVYAVTLASKRQLVFDAQTGQRLADNAKAHAAVKASEPTLPQSFAATIDFARAKEIALAKIPDGEVEGIELKATGNEIVYTVLFADGTSVDVGAVDGTVIESPESAEQTPQPQESPSQVPAEDSDPVPSDPSTEESQTTSPGDSSQDSGI